MLIKYTVFKMILIIIILMQLKKPFLGLYILLLLLLIDKKLLNGKIKLLQAESLKPSRDVLRLETATLRRLL